MKQQLMEIQIRILKEGKNGIWEHLEEGKGLGKYVILILKIKEIFLELFYSGPCK